MKNKIAIQGFEGCFHQEAAQHYFEDNITISACHRFDQVVKKVTNGEVDAGIMAIENSTAGSILSNYGLLQQSNLHITGELFLKIRQHLMLSPKSTIADIKTVHSHPMALLQCKAYLNQHPDWRLVESDDTALSAKEIAEESSRHRAAIASELAAKLYHLTIIGRDIHTEKKNYTRFLILNRKPRPLQTIPMPKASIYFQVENKTGQLNTVLSRIAEHGVNMSKLQSFPIPHQTWRYYFHADLECADIEQLQKTLEAIKTTAKKLRVLGLYNKGITK